MTPAQALKALKLLSEAAQSSASYVPQFAASFISRVREELPEIVDGLEGETGAQVMTEAPTRSQPTSDAALQENGVAAKWR